MKFRNLIVIAALFIGTISCLSSCGKKTAHKDVDAKDEAAYSMVYSQ